MASLPTYFVRKSFEQVKPRLSPGFQRLASDLVDLLDAEGKARVVEVHQALFSANSTHSANAALSRLIHTINRAAETGGIPLRIVITTDKKAGAQRRWVWFEGSVNADVSPMTSELNAIPADHLVNDQRGIPLDTPVLVLLTFNEHETRAVLRHFHPVGTPATRTCNGFAYSDLGIHGGMRVVHRVSRQGQAESQEAVHDAVHAFHPRAIIAVGIAFGVNPRTQRIGDVLVSEHLRAYERGRVEANGTITPRGSKQAASAAWYQRFLHLNHRQNADARTSVYWPKLQFGTLLSGEKLIDNVSYRDALLHLEAEAIGGEMEGVGVAIAADRHKVDWLVVKAISDWADGNKRHDSAEADQALAADNAALVVKAALDLGNLYAELAPPNDGSRLTGPMRDTLPLRVDRASAPTGLPSTGQMRLSDLRGIPDGRRVRSVLGSPTTLLKDPVGEVDALGGKGVHVLPYILEWIDEVDGPPVFALLGEYGMGKTVTSQLVARELEARRTDDPTRPIPLYFDLRQVTGLDQRVPSLKETLEECMRRGWLNDGSRPDYTLENVFEWIHHGAVVIIDGLDEVLVKLKESDGQVFTNTMLKLITDARVPLKLLISCRTQYFRTLRDQKNHFTGQERGQHRADAYRALVLLPFSDAQVLRYLKAAVPAVEPRKLVDLIQSVHNLKELTKRPYTLRLVGEFVPEIERDRLAGRTVSGVTLYRRMAQRWLERDGGKHHIHPDHKMRLAAHLAAYLWRVGQMLLPASVLESWFHEWLASQPDMRRRYAGLHPDQLEEDLRTATFLTREDDGDRSAFRFAHTSLWEFFLAEYLFAAVRADQPDAWAVDIPSDETVGFLGQMLADAADSTLLRTLRQWCLSYRSRTSELVFAYALRARDNCWPTPDLRGIKLGGAQLKGWRIGGSAWLDLGPVDLSGADLRETRFDHVRMAGASFRGARMQRATLVDCTLDRALFSLAQLEGAALRRCSIDRSDWSHATMYRTQFLFCHPESDIPAGDAERFVHSRRVMRAPDPHLARVLVDRRRLAAQPSAMGWVFGCAFSPDGLRLASAGSGGLQVWDTLSAEGVLAFPGHRRSIMSCAFAPDGRHLAAGGVSGTISVWDAVSGELRQTFSGHRDSVRSCDFSPDGRYLASAGDDGTVRSWDLANGKELHTMRGHRGWVYQCIFTSDGRLVISTGKDGTVRWWSAADGTAQRVVHAHTGRALASAISTDGRRAAFLGGSATIIWCETGDDTALHHFETDLDYPRRCAWSPDGRLIAVTGFDGRIFVWDTVSERIVHRLAGHDGWAVCAFSACGRQLALIDEDGRVTTWDIPSGELRLTIESRRVAIGHRWQCTFSPDGRHLASLGDEGAIQIWDTNTGASVRKVGDDRDWIGAFAYAPSGAFIVSGGQTGIVRLLDTSTGRTLRVLRTPRSTIRAIAVSPTGRYLACATREGAVRMWDVETREVLWTCEAEPERVRECVFSPDGRWLALSGFDMVIHIHDAVSGKPLRVLDGNYDWVNTCVSAPDGRHLVASTDDGAIRLWDVPSGRLVRTFRGHRGEIWTCAVSPDGQRLASAGEDGFIRVRELKNGKALLTMAGHDSGTEWCMFSPDGRRLASTGRDATLRLWDATTGTCLRIHALDDAGSHAVWNPNENTLVEATGESWRWLVWETIDDSGAATWVPLETFGPVLQP
jgi:WD40 repeat protein/nucleoside phosphorylase